MKDFILFCRYCSDKIESDFSVLAKQGRDIGVLPIVLFLGSLPISLVISFVLWLVVILFGHFAHSFAVR